MWLFGSANAIVGGVSAVVALLFGLSEGPRSSAEATRLGTFAAKHNVC